MIDVIMEFELIRAMRESMGLPSPPPVPARERYPTLLDDSQLAGCEVTWRFTPYASPPPRTIMPRGRMRAVQRPAPTTIVVALTPRSVGLCDG